MANPVLVEIPKGAWKKVATNVIIGIIHNKASLARYYQTYRMTGDAAPTGETESVPIFIKEKSAIISHSSPIDVYIYCKVFAGKVRVDL